MTAEFLGFEPNIVMIFGSDENDKPTKTETLGASLEERIDLPLTADQDSVIVCETEAPFTCHFLEPQTFHSNLRSDVFFMSEYVKPIVPRKSLFCCWLRKLLTAPWRTEKIRKARDDLFTLEAAQEVTV